MGVLPYMAGACGGQKKTSGSPSTRWLQAPYLFTGLKLGWQPDRAEERPQSMPHTDERSSVREPASQSWSVSPANDVGKTRLASVKEAKQLLLPYTS